MENLAGKIKEAFSSIPVDNILQIAKVIQEKLKNDQTLAKQTKGEDEWGWVTKADTEIQKLILGYFADSALAGTYNIKAEEEFIEDKSIKEKTWQLIVDPLDGTSEFRKGRDGWGVMIGACDNNGVLQYSWNLLSDGTVYKSDIREETKKQSSFRELMRSGKKITIDVYDYGKKDTPDRFKKSCKEIFAVENENCELTSFPSAVWAGGQLANGKLDGLLWLPSELGKKWYPDYDLIFLGALASQGLKIILGKINENNALIAVAPTEDDANKLYEVGISMLKDDQKTKLQKAQNPLQITIKPNT
jgi:fructose-1,6-bisphosphatase/inositol monophosphatase family enzyme